jgi:hypothetical protein
MYRAIRLFAAATAATVAFGAAVPVAVAAPSKPESGKVAASTLKPKAAKVAERISNRLGRNIDKRDTRFGRIVETRLANIDDVAVAAAVRQNLAADQATLGDLRKAALEAADGARNLREVRTDLRKVRTEFRRLRLANYIVTTNLVFRAERLEGVVEANAANLDAATGLDLSAALFANEEAAAAIASAVQKASQVSALSRRPALHDVRSDLRTARQALAVVADALEVVEEPVA